MIVFHTQEEFENAVKKIIANSLNIELVNLGSNWGCGENIVVQLRLDDSGEFSKDKIIIGGVDIRY